MKLPKLTIPKPPRAVVVTVIVVLGVCIVVTGASAAVRAVYSNRILPNVTLGGVDIGGLSQGEAITKLQATYDAMLEQPLLVSMTGSTVQEIALRMTTDDASHALIDFDATAAAAQAFGVGRYDEHPFESQVFPLLHLVGIRHDRIAAYTVTNEEHLMQTVRSLYPDVEVPVTATDFVFTANNDGYDVTVTPPENGTAIDTDAFLKSLHEDAMDLALGQTIIATRTLTSNVTVDDAATLANAATSALTAAPYTLSYTAENRTEPETWEITESDLTKWITPGRDEDGALMLTLDATAMADFLTTLHDDIDVAAQNARFAMENNRVSEFAASHDGVTVNDTDTIRAISDFLGVADTEVLVMVDRVTPTVTTESVNNLGISEVLGVGTSDFKGSPANRIANITHGADKLNGLLIAPGETVSLLDNLKPFTIEDGYLPELVIKGDEIKPEIGGGLCQIGTTTFRAVMNSGLHVVERRNHSLVVSYYNDPSNNNPGTDATIYDPAPDFKFENDTANYILLATEVNLTDKKLYFTFWGTSDDRTASYTPPEVLSWSGYGATTYKTTDTLAPGVEKCQAGHPGATTTFTYNISYADGTTHTEEFFSSYRSLPKICLVGKSDEAVPVDSESSTPAPDESAEPEELTIDTSIE